MEENYPGCRNAIREALKFKGVPEESIEIMISSLADSSIKQYNTCLRKWWRFCYRKKVNPYECEITQVLKFLTEEFEKGASHGTVNSCRSAIALLQGPSVGDDPQIKRLLKGISKLRPGKPKYDATWDPQIVLSHFI